MARSERPARPLLPDEWCLHGGRMSAPGISGDQRLPGGTGPGRPEPIQGRPNVVTDSSKRRLQCQSASGEAGGLERGETFAEVGRK
ncbi:MAG TPA: hypothetical protein VME46_04660, partial [Acidimicrobiales bacterium]|nr:hypothetical protein [Acidimicrobiales bacterium]